MNDEIPYNPPGMDEYFAEAARKNSELILKLAIQDTLNLLPEVTWDRWCGYYNYFIGFGWINRDDGKLDFVTVTIENGECTSFQTSSVKFSDDFGNRLGLDDVHHGCKRIEHDFKNVNCIKL